MHNNQSHKSPQHGNTIPEQENANTHKKIKLPLESTSSSPITIKQENMPQKLQPLLETAQNRVAHHKNFLIERKRRASEERPKFIQNVLKSSCEKTVKSLRRAEERVENLENYGFEISMEETFNEVDEKELDDFQFEPDLEDDQRPVAEEGWPSFLYPSSSP
uniref:Uncharacterized protein n=1 Tax=Caenorhabditis japonica TaxID=281687 RepID=A0A8R1HP45_CAEJA